MKSISDNTVSEIDPTWKLKLRYGKMTTPYRHFTLLADGCAENLADKYDCRPGRAWMAMKVWATDEDEAADMICSIGRHLGFDPDGTVHIYVTEPDAPPRENPHGYDITFTPYDEK